MTHARPIPDAATPPWPAHPAPREKTEVAAAPPPQAETERKSETDWGRVGVGIGIGSAAIVAALLYSNYGRKKPREKGRGGR